MTGLLVGEEEESVAGSSKEIVERIVRKESAMKKMGCLETSRDGKRLERYAEGGFCEIKMKVKYLGHVVSAGSVGPDSSKIEAMLQWPPPTSVRALKGFLGLTGFYRKFIKGYSALASPLTDLLRKDAFQWSPEAQTTFDKLKHVMSTAPVLALPDFSKPFVIQSDASGIAMGAVLSQDQRPIAFFSKKFCSRMMQTSTYLRELHAITAAIKKWRQYLLGHFFIVQTDHKPLKDLLTQTVQTLEQQFYVSKLIGYNYTIQYRAGSSNVAADALSRITATDNLMYVFIPICGSPNISLGPSR
ncbi:hypothetical protein V8G54_015126 [Vigna mungo]|uniref:Reverse transcriptase/retrotransposon-derived protein RNase H-like domain-containing protein n=1 Tax=Vigna mungo TaxID=3915 RepID=A0AAQ3NKF4_VIGMU